MLQRWFGTKAHSRLHYLTLLFFVVGMVCSKFLMSMGLLIGALNLLLEADFKTYYRRISENRVVHLLLLEICLIKIMMFGKGLLETIIRFCILIKKDKDTS